MKKKILTALAALMLLTPMTVNQVASAATIADFGTPDSQATAAYGTYKYYNYTENGNGQKLFYTEFKPTADSDYEFVVHDVRNSSGGVTLSTVSAIAADFEADTGRQVLFATNGDFFDGTGYSIDSLVQKGEVIKVGQFANKNAFGFDNNGNAVVGRLTETKDVLEFSCEGKSYRLDIAGLNVKPTGDEISIYTTAQNLAVNGCIKYKASLKDENSTLTTVRPLELICKASVKADKLLTLSSGQIAIVAEEGSKAQELLSKALKYGVEFRVINAPDGNFAGMDYVVGGWEILVNNGVIPTLSSHTDSSDAHGGGVNRARTMIGIKPDGTMFLAVIDERNSSTGCTVKEEADLALALGAKYALELDGGGSSTFLRSQDGSDLILCNSPSDGSQRRVSNAVLIVEKDKNAPDYLGLDDYTADADEPVTDGDGSGENGGNQSGENGENNGNQSSGGSTGSVLAGCGGTLGGVSVIAGAAAIAAITLIKKHRGDNDEESN